MKQGWEIKKLSEVCTIKPPKKEAKEIVNENDAVTFLPMEDLGILDKTIKPVKEKAFKDVSGSYTYFADNDVLLAKITPCFENGKLGIAKNLTNGIGFGSSEYIVFRSNGQITEEYLFYLLSQENFREEGSKRMTGAVGHKRVSKEFIENYKILLPPLPEQEQIVSILDEAFAAIDKAKANAQKNLENAQELFESYLEGVFDRNDQDWMDKPLKELTSKIGSGATPRGGQKNYKPEGISLVRSMNVHDLEFRERNLAFIDDKQAKELEGVTLQQDDVLLNITGASIARCCVIPVEYLPARVNQHVSIIRAKKELVNPRFLNLLLTSRKYKDRLLFTGEQGATRQAITKAQIEAFKVSIPSLEIQQQILLQLDRLRAESNALEAIYLKKLECLDELRKAILQKAFVGELETDVEKSMQTL